MMPEPIRIFVSYSHKDRAWFKRLQPLFMFDNQPTHLAYAWHDNELNAGDRWHDEICKELDRKDVFLCLLSHHFTVSRYIKDVEKRAALSRQERGESTIVRLYLEDMNPRDITDFKPFQSLPEHGKSWLCYKLDGSFRLAHKPIRTGLLNVIEIINQTRAKSIMPAGTPPRA